MSIVFSVKEGWIISHLQYLNDAYKHVKTEYGSCVLVFNRTLFEINSQYLRQNQIVNSIQNDTIILENKTKKRKQLKLLPQEQLNEINYIQQAFDRIISNAKKRGLFQNNIIANNNKEARLVSQKFYTDTFLQALENLHGCNDSDIAVISKALYETYVFPKHCNFYCYDVRDIAEKMELRNQYDFILLDPPWWNKSIRRKKCKCVEASYKMMYNEDLIKIPIGRLLHSNGIVAIWCTNAPSHLHSISNEIFPSWGITYKAKWYWVKITQVGDTICNFNLSPGKQPFELLILGSASKDNEINIPDGKLLISIPSAVHSHKPPLTDVIQEYLPNKPNCLEIFARYLLPGWTSWGLEVLKFQDLSLYTITEKKSNTEDIVNN